MVVQFPAGQLAYQSTHESLNPWHGLNYITGDFDSSSEIFNQTNSLDHTGPTGHEVNSMAQIGFETLLSASAFMSNNMVTSSFMEAPAATNTSSKTLSSGSPTSGGALDSASPPPPFPLTRVNSTSNSQHDTSSALRTVSSIEYSKSLPLLTPAITPSCVPILPQPPKLSQKRRRPITDVDGVGTADMCIKKRRIRLHLITSRLSQPYSIPATHILNREAIAGLPGEGKRFVKLAAYLSARRAAVSAAQTSHISHNPSSVDLLRRAAILNRLRIRVRSSMLANQILAYGQRHQPAGPDLNTAAAVSHHGMQLVNAARYFFPSPTTPTAPPPQHQHSSSATMRQWHQHHTPIHVHTAPGPAPMSQHYGALLPQANPVSAEIPSVVYPVRAQKVEYNHARLPPSPKLSATRVSRGRRLGPSPLARSPDLIPTRERAFDESDEVDNDSVAFPTSELGNRYADDSDEEEGQDGYDLGAIFGASKNPDSDLTADELDDLEFGMLDDQVRESNEHFYEEYLDELDGIPRDGIPHAATGR